jgi:uncharacterized tellurite resistance protein B-like protein
MKGGNTRMTNYDILCSVLSLLAIDGKLSRPEMHFFDELCERLSVSEEEKEKVLQQIKQGKGSVHLPEDEADKKRLLYFLVQAAVADGKVQQKEQHVLDTVTDRLGVDKGYVQKFLDRRLEEIKHERYTRKSGRTIACPKCGHEQPESHKCRRCGIIFEKYKQAKGPSDEDKLRELFATTNSSE